MILILLIKKIRVNAELANTKNGLSPTAKDVAGIFIVLRLLMSCIKFGVGRIRYSCYRMKSYRMN